MNMSRYRYRPVTVPLPFWALRYGPLPFSGQRYPTLLIVTDRYTNVTHRYPPLPIVTHRYPPLPTVTHRYPPLPNVTVTCVTRVTDSYKRRFKLFKIEIKKKYMFANYLFKIRANWRFNGNK